MRVIKCTYLNFAVFLTFPFARDPTVVLNEYPFKLIYDTCTQI